MSSHSVQGMGSPRMPYYDKRRWLTVCGRCGRKHPPERLLGWIRESHGHVLLYLYFQIEGVDWREDLLRCPHLEDRHLISALDKVISGAQKITANAGMPQIEELGSGWRKLMLACLKRMVANEINRLLWLGRHAEKLRFVFDIAHPTRLCGEVRTGNWPADFYLDPQVIDVHLSNGCKFKKVDRPPWLVPPDPKSHTAEFFDIEALRLEYDREHPELLSGPYNSMIQYSRYLPPHPHELVNLPRECTTSGPLENPLTHIEILNSLVEHSAQNGDAGLVSGALGYARLTAQEAGTENAYSIGAPTHQFGATDTRLENSSRTSDASKAPREQATATMSRKHKKRNTDWAPTEEMANNASVHPASTEAIQSRKRNSKAHDHEATRNSKREARKNISAAVNKGSGSGAVANPTGLPSAIGLEELIELGSSPAHTAAPTSHASSTTANGNRLSSKAPNRDTTVSTDQVIDLTQDDSDEDNNSIRACGKPNAASAVSSPTAGNRDDRHDQRDQPNLEQPDGSFSNTAIEDDSQVSKHSFDASITKKLESARAPSALLSAPPRQDSVNEGTGLSRQASLSSRPSLNAPTTATTKPSTTAADDAAVSAANILLGLANVPRNSSDIPTSPAQRTPQARLYSPHIALIVAFRVELATSADIRHRADVSVKILQHYLRAFSEYLDLIVASGVGHHVCSFCARLDDAARLSHEFDVELGDLEQQAQEMKAAGHKRYTRLYDAAWRAIDQLSQIAEDMGFDVSSFSADGCVSRIDEDGDDGDGVPLAMVRAWKKVPVEEFVDTVAGYTKKVMR